MLTLGLVAAFRADRERATDGSLAAGACRLAAHGTAASAAALAHDRAAFSR